MLGNFNTDTEALRQRERLNSTLAKHNLEDWIVKCARPRTHERILDIGCGTGKQIFDLAKRLGPNLNILGIDLSEEAVEAVRARAQEERLNGVSVQRMDIDECVDRLSGQRFDLILSTYAIYYASDLPRIMRRLASLLHPQGRAFLVGPGEGTNKELVAILRDVTTSPEGMVNDFISQTSLASVRNAWSKVDEYRLSNEIDFPDLESVMEWWRSHNSFRQGLQEDLSLAIREVITLQGSFRLTKNVLGVLLQGPLTASKAQHENSQ